MGDDLTFRHEIVRGQREEVFALSVRVGLTIQRLARAIWDWAEAGPGGASELYLVYRLSASPETCRFADVGYVSEERWPPSRPMSVTDEYWSVVPDLAAYVIRPTDYFTDVMARLDDFLDAGSKSVWLIDPERATVQVIEAGARDRPRVVSDELTDENALPGFAIRLPELFSHYA